MMATMATGTLAVQFTAGCCKTVTVITAVSVLAAEQKTSSEGEAIKTSN